MENIIDQTRCKKCKLCIEVCPCNILDVNESNQVYFIPEREKICLHCGQCMAMCKSEAITVNAFSYQKHLIKLPENKVAYNDFYNFLATRRSVRNFKDTPVPKEIITKIIDSLAFAPYGASPNKVSITVVNNRSKIEEALPLISQFLDNVVKWMESGFMRYMIKRKKGIETFNTLKHHLYPIAKLGNYKLEYGDRITRDAQAIIIFHAPKGAEEHTNNSIIYATYAMLTAHSLGLGATMAGLVPAGINKLSQVKELFQIPEENEAITSVILGYPKYKYNASIIRKKENLTYID